MPPRRKAAADGPGPSTAASSPRRKRARPDPSSPPDELSEDAAPNVSTPSKRRRRGMALPSLVRGNPEAEEEQEGSNDDGKMDAMPVTPATPSHRGRGTRSAAPRTPSGRMAKIGAMVVTTPSRRAVVTPRRRQAYDHSARKKSMRSLVERAARDDDDGSDDDSLAREICESESESDSCGGGEEEEEEQEQTPSKRTMTARRRAAPARRRSPTPPRNLPAHERFFFDTKPGRPKTSDQTLVGVGAADLLSHDEYFALARELERHPRAHGPDRCWLEDLHAQSFPQWAFELREGFGVCLYGLGSKRGVVRRFADFLSSSSHSSAAFGGRIVVINGYVRSITAKDILSAIWTALFPAQKVPAAQPAALIGLITAHICAGGGGHDSTATTTTTTTTGPPLTLLINSIDAPPMRRPGLQNLVATLAATLRPRIQVLCTADTPDFALLWDAGRRTALNLVFHDCTTLAPLGGAELDVVDEVHELLGRRARRAGGREGVAFVLRSLPEKARRMFGLLVGEVLVAMQEEEGGGGQSGETVAVEWRMVYNKAVEEFICGSEMAFRTLLKEFYDHQMVISRTDALGTEMLSLPFRREELEGILEDICEEE